MLIEAVDKEREGRRASLLPFPSRTMMARPSTDRQEKLRILEALLFAAPEPLDQAELARHFAEGEDVASLLTELQNPLCRARRQSRARRRQMGLPTRPTSPFCSSARPLSSAACRARRSRTLAIIAYHQPVTRAEIEEIRASAPRERHPRRAARNRLDQARGRRRARGRPVTYGTTEQFLGHFGFDPIQDPPGLSELKGAGLLDSTLPPWLRHAQSRRRSGAARGRDPLEGELGEDDEVPKATRARPLR